MRRNIAINMSGALRSFNFCAGSIQKHIISKLSTKYNIYIFGHFWIFGEDNTDIEYGMKWKNDTENYEKKINQFKFTDFRIEKYDSNWEREIIGGCHGEIILEDYKEIKNENEKNSYMSYAVNCMGMYYKIKECSKLLERYEEQSGKKMDYILRLRPDFFWHTDIPIDILEKISDTDIVLVKDSYCINANWNSNDKFFMGTKNMMDKYCDMYNYLLHFHNKNIRIEGQNVAREMINDMNLNTIYFGDEKTYSKATEKFVKKMLKKRQKKLKKLNKLQ